MSQAGGSVRGTTSEEGRANNWRLRPIISINLRDSNYKLVRKQDADDDVTFKLVQNID